MCAWASFVQFMKSEEEKSKGKGSGFVVMFFGVYVESGLVK